MKPRIDNIGIAFRLGRWHVEIAIMGLDGTAPIGAFCHADIRLALLGALGNLGIFDIPPALKVLLESQNQA